jgi:hypothetical protein
MRWPEQLALALCLGVVSAGCAPPLAERLLTPSLGTWTRAGPIRRFTADNLYDCIDGEADYVISFGFRSLAQAAYRRSARAETTVDIYDMGSAPNAFALFRSRANVEAQPIDLGSEGACDEARAEFWQHRFYLALSMPSSAERESVLALARRLADALPPTKAWPTYLELLPVTGRVARSEQYLPTDFLGHEFLQRAVSARYRLGDREAMLFACRYDAPREAAQALDRFDALLRTQRPTQPLALGEGGFVTSDPLLGRLVVFRRGCFVGGLTRYANDPGTKRLLADLDRRLRSR